MTADKTLTIISVSAGDIVLIGSSYFHVIDVHDPTHPAAPGVVWDGYWWRSREGHWGALTVVHMHDGSPSPQVLDHHARELCGWGDL